MPLAESRDDVIQLYAGLSARVVQLGGRVELCIWRASAGATVPRPARSPLRLTGRSAVELGIALSNAGEAAELAEAKELLRRQQAGRDLWAPPGGKGG
jgi:hypothetical protein